MRTRALATLTTVLLTATPLAAQDDFRTREGRPVESPPSSDQAPLPVSLGVYLIQVSNLDQILQTFEIEGYLEAGWYDPRLAFDAEEFGAPVKIHHNERARTKLGEEVWWPSIEFVNASGGGSLDRHWLEIDTLGNVAYTARFNGLITSSMDLRKFPFDSQVLRIPIESYFHEASEVEFVVNPASTGFDQSRSLPEWTFLDVATSVDVNDYAQLGDFFGEYSRFNFEISIERQWGFYVWKIFLPLAVILACSWTVFWIRDLSVNVGVSFTILLTVVAFNLAIADTLPKVPYLTFLDATMVVSYVSVFLSLVTVVTASSFEERGMEGMEERIKRVSRWAFPTSLLGVVGGLALVFLGG